MILSHDEQTIIAQCTPIGTGAIALLRISGADAITITDRFTQLASNKSLSEATSHTVHYGSIQGKQREIIDRVMFIIMHAPRTFTGQNVVEITTHNNQFVIEAIIATAIRHGARLAQQGEFSRRAVLNGKIDLLQAEAISELLSANTQFALKKSLAQLDGSFSHWVHKIEQQLLHALAFSEASFEFIDEEDLAFSRQIEAIIISILDTITQLKQTFDQQQQIKQGIRIALIGSVNAGKSSLFNALLKKDRAIVTNIAGTTRDSIEAGLYRNGNYWTLIDTAGLRHTNDIIEQQGIDRSHKEAELADIILLVIDGARSMSNEEEKAYRTLLDQYIQKTIIVHTKADLAPVAIPLANHGYLASSASNATSIDPIHQAIEQKISILFDRAESPFLLNQRQFNLLMGLEQKLHALLPQVRHAPQYEIISYHLQDALTLLSELTGKSISEAGMDAVFRNFCVGK